LIINTNFLLYINYSIKANKLEIGHNFYLKSDMKIHLNWLWSKILKQYFKYLFTNWKFLYKNTVHIINLCLIKNIF